MPMLVIYYSENQPNYQSIKPSWLFPPKSPIDSKRPGLRGAPAVGVLHEGQETQPAAVER